MYFCLMHNLFSDSNYSHLLILSFTSIQNLMSIFPFWQANFSMLAPKNWIIGNLRLHNTHSFQRFFNKTQQYNNFLLGNTPKNYTSRRCTLFVNKFCLFLLLFLICELAQLIGAKQAQGGQLNTLHQKIILCIQVKYYFLYIYTLSKLPGFTTVSRCLMPSRVQFSDKT